MLNKRERIDKQRKTTATREDGLQSIQKTPSKDSIQEKRFQAANTSQRVQQLKSIQLIANQYMAPQRDQTNAAPGMVIQRVPIKINSETIFDTTEKATNMTGAISNFKNDPEALYDIKEQLQAVKTENGKEQGNITKAIQRCEMFLGALSKPLNRPEKQKEGKPPIKEEEEEKRQEAPEDLKSTGFPIPQHGSQVELHNHLSGVIPSSDLLALWKQYTSKDSLKQLNDHSKAPKKVSSAKEEEQLLHGKGGKWIEAYGIRQAMIDEITIAPALEEQQKVNSSSKEQQKPQTGAQAFLALLFKTLQEQHIVYAELQGDLPKNVDAQLWQKVQAKLFMEINLLKRLSTTELALEEGKKFDPKNIHKKLNNIAEDQIYVGVDFNGPEANFTENGMQALNYAYNGLRELSAKLGRPLVLRPHVGEGDVRSQAQLQLNAQNNLDLVINELVKTLGQKKQVSGHVIVRLGHATHATVKQLEVIAKLATDSKSVYVEANLGSNIHTHSVGSEQEASQVLLRMMYMGTPTVLSTDGGGVMETSLPQEWERAKTIIESFKKDEIELDLGGEKIKFSEIKSPEIQQRFSTEWLESHAKNYHEQIKGQLK